MRRDLEWRELRRYRGAILADVKILAISARGYPSPDQRQSRPIPSQPRDLANPYQRMGSGSRVTR